MNNSFVKYSLLAVVATLSLLSCARDVVETSESVEKRVLEAYIKVVHKDSLQPTASGLYVLREKMGTGAVVENRCGVYVRYSVMDIKDNYASTTDPEIAKRIGGYSKTKYYGPVLFETGYGSLIKGIEEALLKMREGGKAKIIIPSWLSYYDIQGSSKAHATTTIYEIEVIKVVKELQTFITDTLEAYSAKYYGGMDSITKNYYFKSTKEGIGKQLKVGESIKFWYVGRLLDGFVFDTNIEDTARKYDIYNPSRTGGYTALAQTLQEDTQTGDGSVVKGMAKTFLRMKHGEKAITFFGPDLGYGSASKDFGKYQPLFFSVEIVTDNKEDL